MKDNNLQRERNYFRSHKEYGKIDFYKGKRKERKRKKIKNNKNFQGYIAKKKMVAREGLVMRE